MQLFTRNNPEKHPMLQQLLHASRVNVRTKKSFSFFYEANIEDGNNVIVFDDPISVIVGNLRYLFVGGKKIYWMLELYEHQVKINSLYRFFRYLFFAISGYLAVVMADAVLVSSKLRLDYVSKRYRIFIKNKKLKVIYNVPNLEINEKVNNGYIQKIKEFTIGKIALAIYAGSIQEGRDVEDFIQAFSNDSDFGLVLCGPIKNEGFRSRFKNSNSILYLGNLRQGEVLEVYKYCHIGLLSYDNYPVNVRLCAPVKIWEYLRANLKIVGNKNYALETEWKCFISAFYDNKDNIRYAVTSALESSSEINMDGVEFSLADFQLSDWK